MTAELIESKVDIQPIDKTHQGSVEESGGKVVGVSESEPKYTYWTDPDHRFPPYGLHVPGVERDAQGFRRWTEANQTEAVDRSGFIK
jgi:hypothetical protein